MNVKEVLLKAIECDTADRVLQAQKLYREGIKQLTEIVTNEPDVLKKKAFMERIQEYIIREEQIQKRVKNYRAVGQAVTHIHIEENSVGHSYRTLFSKYLTADVKEVLMEEPYMDKYYQFQNLISFFELLVKCCKSLTYVRLVTKPAQGDAEQAANFQQIKADVSTYKVTFDVFYDDTLHDRQIILSNGYRIKIGRGLDFYKAPTTKLSMGSHDYDFRLCKQTDVDIFKNKV